MQIIVVYFLYHVFTKKSNSSSCFKDKICELHKYKKNFIGDIATKLEDNAL